jgi:excisionase family DNA binding protein
MNEKLLNGSQVADSLSISRAFAYQLMRHGRIRSVRIGRSIRVRPSDLADFILKNVIDETNNYDYKMPTLDENQKSFSQG